VGRWNVLVVVWVSMVSEMCPSVESTVRESVMTKVSVSVSVNHRCFNMCDDRMMWECVRNYGTVV